MDFTVFPTGSTNIFPLANDGKARGGLMTEYNLRSRESVGTNQYVNYMYGPSYTHGQDDFAIRIQQDDAGTTISSSTLEILSGRAVVNGHYVESLVNVTIDLLDANTTAKLNGTEVLKGALVVGLRAMYSTETTMAGAMLKDNKDEFYEGVKVVILPEDEFKLPEDVPNNKDLVTAHLKLGTFNFTNNAINTLVNNSTGKLRYIDAARISDVETLLSDTYISKAALNPKKLYVFAGKGTDEVTGLDTWCDALDSLMVWDSNPQLTTTAPSLSEAAFGTTTSGKTQLAIPHKQVDGMVNTAGTAQYYATKTLTLPLADYNSGTAGTVNSTYTNNVKAVANKIYELYTLSAGKQIWYIDQLDDIADLPTISQYWDNGDYVVVNLDNTLNESTDSVRAPSTLYLVLPGCVSSYAYKASTNSSSSSIIPSSCTGVMLGESILDASTDAAPNTSDPNVYLEYFDLTAGIRGVVGEDYFRIQYVDSDSGTITYYYYLVSESGSRMWSDAIWLTGEIPLAQTDVIGGFYNVEDTDTDAGYVYRDDSGHLVLLDYSLLRSGTLAYQLGEDIEISSGLTAEEIQDYLDDYVNNRVAFPNSDQTANSDTPNIINLTINISEEDDATEINIYNIDSRFSACVYLHITGSATSNCTINITNCEKIRIDSNISGSPVINLYNSCLWYDSSVLDDLSEISGLSFWYEKFDDTDPSLLVDDMTIREYDASVVAEDIDYWNESTPNDNHFTFALHSVTFSPEGYIVGASIYVRNETTSNISEGDYVITSEFDLPQGSGLSYPISRLTKQVKITGTFVNAYVTTSPVGYMVMDTNFSLLTGAYDEYDTSNYTTGMIAFHVRAVQVTNVTGLDAGTSIDAWESNAFHAFAGSVIG